MPKVLKYQLLNWSRWKKKCFPTFLTPAFIKCVYINNKYVCNILSGYPIKNNN